MGRKLSRVFNICQYERDPKTGEDFHFSEENIKRGVAHKSIKYWAYILHDKDQYTEEEEKKDIEDIEKQYDMIISDGGSFTVSKDEYIKERQKKHKGYVKPRHWHVVLKSERAIDVDTIAKWFGIPSGQIDVPSGRGRFLDCVEYLTHENERSVLEGKHRYDDKEVTSNFDFREELDKRKVKRGEIDEETPFKLRLRMMVKDGELSLRQAEELYPEQYVQDADQLQKFRAMYLRHAPQPPIRYNFYIYGTGGVGKGLASRALARLLFPDIEKDEDLFFPIGADGTTFEGYDGQPVIIWNDCRNYELKQKLGSRGNIFNVFDPFPQRQRQNVKYGSVNLVNSVNIVNSTEPYEEFLLGLVGEYKNKKTGITEKEAEWEEKVQSYRRFPFILPLRAEDFDLFINNYFMGTSGKYDDYTRLFNIPGNFARMAQDLSERSKLFIETSREMVKPFLRAIEQKNEEQQKRIMVSDEPTPEIIEKYKNYGRLTIENID